MIKGDLRKKQILETAESLFTERGYEKTGVQDILDVLHLSKGSFYHHFVSKEQVLQQICEQRAVRAAERLRQMSFASGVEQMDALLRGMIPFQGEGLTFLKMILPIFVLPEGKSVVAAYQEALKRNWIDGAEEALLRMIREGTAYTFYPRKTAEMALDLVNALWAEIGQAIILAEKRTREPVAAGELLAMTEPYRPAIENLFSAPYGSLELIRLEDLKKMTLEIHHWWMIDPIDPGPDGRPD